MALPSWARKDIAGVPAWAWALALVLLIAATMWLRKRRASSEVEVADEGTYLEDPTYTLPGGSEGVGGGDDRDFTGDEILSNTETIGGQLEGISEQIGSIGSQLGELIPQPDDPETWPMPGPNNPGPGNNTDVGTPTDQLPPDVLGNLRKRARLTGRLIEQRAELERDRARKEKTQARIDEVKRGGVESKKERKRLADLRDKKENIQGQIERDKTRIGKLKEKKQAVPAPPDARRGKPPIDTSPIDNGGTITYPENPILFIPDTLRRLAPGIAPPRRSERAVPSIHKPSKAGRR